MPLPAVDATDARRTYGQRIARICNSWLVLTPRSLEPVLNAVSDPIRSELSACVQRKEPAVASFAEYPSCTSFAPMARTLQAHKGVAVIR